MVRIATAAAVAQRAYGSGATTVFLARADVFSDALAAGTLNEGPVLLVPPCGEAPVPVIEAVEALDPFEVIALGGTQAVCDDLLTAVAGDRGVNRLARADRASTAVAVSRRAFPDGAAAVYLADADDDAPDAVAGGSLQGGPILLVAGGEPPSAVVREEVQRLQPSEVIALGGPPAVSDEALEAVADGRGSRRLAGPSRIETAAAVVSEAYTFSTDVAYLARADVFADAVAAGSLIDGPVLLVPPCGPLPEVVGEQISRLEVEEVIALGGTEAVCDDILAAAAALAVPQSSSYRDGTWCVGTPEDCAAATAARSGGSGSAVRQPDPMPSGAAAAERAAVSQPSLAAVVGQRYSPQLWGYQRGVVPYQRCFVGENRCSPADRLLELRANIEIRNSTGDESPSLARNSYWTQEIRSIDGPPIRPALRWGCVGDNSIVPDNGCGSWRDEPERWRAQGFVFVDEPFSRTTSPSGIFHADSQLYFYDFHYEFDIFGSEGRGDTRAFAGQFTSFTFECPRARACGFPE